MAFCQGPEIRKLLYTPMRDDEHPRPVNFVSRESQYFLQDREVERNI